MVESLEDVIRKKINPLVEEAMQKFLGVSISELNKDISQKLTKNPLIEFEVDTRIPFKEAKLKGVLPKEKKLNFLPFKVSLW